MSAKHRLFYLFHRTTNPRLSQLQIKLPFTQVKLPFTQVKLPFKKAPPAEFLPQRRFLFLLSSCRILFCVKMIHDVLAKLILVRIELHELFSFDILAINGIDVRHITGRQKICQLL